MITLITSVNKRGAAVRPTNGPVKSNSIFPDPISVKCYRNSLFFFHPLPPSPLSPRWVSDESEAVFFKRCCNKPFPRSFSLRRKTVGRWLGGKNYPVKGRFLKSGAIVCGGRTEVSTCAICGATPGYMAVIRGPGGRF